MRIFYYLFLSLCVLVVFLEGLHPAWKNHLIFDVYIYFERSTYLLNNHNLSGVQNEYQPGAIIYFALLSPLLLLNNSLDSFIKIFFLSNFVLIFIIAFLVEKLTSPKNILILSLLILFIGPILFYRFELLVVCLTITCFYFLRRKRQFLSTIFLSLAILTKLYPVIYVPFLLLLEYREKGLKKFLSLSSIFVSFIVLFIFTYLFFFHISPAEFIYSLNYHTTKPVGVEGVWSSIISTTKLILSGYPPTLVSGNYTWGVSTSDFFIPSWIIDNFWILALEIVYFVVLTFKKSHFIENILLLTLTMLVFSKQSAPQYLIWFLFLLPLINFEKYLHQIRYTFLLFLSLVISFLSQYIYPLNYTEFLQFFNNQSNSYLFYINLVRNILLLCLFYFLIPRKDES